MKKVEETPKIMHIGGWTAAVIGAAVFAAVVGVFMYQRANAPIEAKATFPAPPASLVGQGVSSSSQSTAATTQAQTSCTNVALNNYPGLDVVNAGAAEYKHGIFESQMGGTWRCNEYCVPGIDTTQKLDSDNNQEAVKKYLSGKTMGGQGINVVKSGKGFQELLLQPSPGVTMARTVILDSTKNVCMGYKEGKGWSTNYEKMVDANGTVTAPAVDNLTAADAKKYQEEVTAQEKAAAGEDPTSYGPQGPLGAPTSGGKPRSPIQTIQKQPNGTTTVQREDRTLESRSTPDQLKDTLGKFASCKDIIRKRFTDDSWIQKLGKVLKAYPLKLGSIEENYPEASLKTLDKAQEALEACYRMSDEMNDNARVAISAPTEETNQVYSQNCRVVLSFKGQVDYSSRGNIISPTHVCGYVDGNPSKSTYSQTSSKSSDFFSIGSFVDGEKITSSLSDINSRVLIYAWNAGSGFGRARNILNTYTVGQFQWDKTTTTKDSDGNCVYHYKAILPSKLVLKGNLGELQPRYEGSNVPSFINPLTTSDIVKLIRDTYFHATGNYCTGSVK